MNFLRFYWAVFRESFRHSLDIAQGAIFIIIIVGGVIATGNPRAKMTLDQMDLSGWKAAAIIFGLIILIRLLLAPYWLYQRSIARNIETPERTIDFGLRCTGFTVAKDEFTQVRFSLTNSLNIALQYQVDDVCVILEGEVIDFETPKQKRWIVGAGTTAQYFYPRFAIDTRLKTAMATARIVYKFGLAGGVLCRRAVFSAELTIYLTDYAYTIAEDYEESIYTKGHSG
jgi:hypothetical protein